MIGVVIVVVVVIKIFFPRALCICLSDLRMFVNLPSSRPHSLQVNMHRSQIKPLSGLKSGLSGIISAITGLKSGITDL